MTCGRKRRKDRKEAFVFHRTADLVEATYIMSRCIYRMIGDLFEATVYVDWDGNDIGVALESARQQLGIKGERINERQ